MSNTYFQFKKFRINQDRCAMKVTTDACILGAITPVHKTGHVLDIGTGTGLLALMIAQRSKCTIDAIELDEESFLQATENVKNSPWADRIKVIHGDVRKFKPRKKYDLIICNPPFFENQLKSPDRKRNMVRHQSQLTARQLMNAVHRLLKPKGVFSAILSTSEEEKWLNACLSVHLAVNDLLFIIDHPAANIKRVLLQASTRKKSYSLQRPFLLKNEKRNYTPEFIKLMNPFYLQF